MARHYVLVGGLKGQVFLEQVGPGVLPVSPKTFSDGSDIQQVIRLNDKSAGVIYPFLIHFHIDQVEHQRKAEYPPDHLDGRHEVLVAVYLIVQHPDGRIGVFFVADEQFLAVFVVRKGQNPGLGFEILDGMGTQAHRPFARQQGQ